MSRECDRCGGQADPIDKLPFAQYNDEHGRHPVLCEDCRNELVEWIDA